MQLSPENLIVKKSKIPNAGKGLFTKVDIERGTKIVEYLGRISTWADADYQGGRNPYLFYVNKNHVIDGATDKKSLGRFVNDSKGLTDVPGLRNNCKFEKDGLRVFIIAMKKIAAGSELLVGYGKEYWDIIKQNMASEETVIIPKSKKSKTAKTKTKV